MKHFLKNKSAVSFFLFDAVIAAIVFFMAVALILASTTKSPEIETPKAYSDNLMNYYLDTQVSDVENDYVSQLLANKIIEDPSRTIIEQIIIFADKEMDEINNNFTRYISEDKIPLNYGFNITITNTTNTKLIYQREPVGGDLSSKINLKRIIITEDFSGNIIGPLIFSVNIWY